MDLDGHVKALEPTNYTMDGVKQPDHIEEQKRSALASAQGGGGQDAMGILEAKQKAEEMAVAGTLPIDIAVGVRVMIKDLNAHPEYNREFNQVSTSTMILFRHVSSECRQICDVLLLAKIFKNKN